MQPFKPRVCSRQNLFTNIYTRARAYARKVKKYVVCTYVKLLLFNKFFNKLTN